MNVSEVRMPHARAIVILAALVASAAILWMARSYTFYYDEWTFILTSPDWNWSTILVPHNVHPSMLPRLIYAALLHTVGLRTYLPYLVILLALNATSVVLLFELVRLRAGDLIGLALGSILLVLGEGWDDLLWAFQIGFVGSVACGLGMLLALEAAPTRRHIALAAALLTGSLMFSGIGLVFGVAAVVGLAATRDRRKHLAWFVPVAIVFGAWFLAYGRFGGQPNPPPSPANILVLPQYVLWGLGSSAAAVLGEGGLFGPPLLLLAAGAVAFSWSRGGVDPLALAIAAALVTFYAVTGLSRAQLGYQQSASSRYVYVGAVFWLILLAGAARSLPWRGTWRPAIVACLFLAVFSNSVLLFTFAVAKTVQMQRQVADLQALAAVRGDPCLNPNGAVDPLVMPPETSPAIYYRAVDKYGDPWASLPIVDRSDFDQARSNLLVPGCK
jgi:hypothetical protein